VVENILQILHTRQKVINNETYNNK